MSVAEYLKDVPLPKMMRVRQYFAAETLDDVNEAIHSELCRPEIGGTIKKGMTVALAVGSRGMDRLTPIVHTLVAELKLLGAHPFIVPAMGSHGGATAEGQTAVLAELGVTEESAGCPIRSSMETVELTILDNGLPVLMDKNVMQADGIIPLNRVKPHTGFSGDIESGIAKMLSIGLGKHRGAASCHAMGYGYMGNNIIEMAKIKLCRCPILFGLATVENAYDKVKKISALPCSTLIEEEKMLLVEAKKNMPGILVTPLDVLVVDCMGKEYSGMGTDPNITGRANTPYVQTTQKTGRLVILDLSDKSKGNAAGVGLADIITKRLFSKINLETTYINHLTSQVLSGAVIPMVMDSDRLAVQAALKTCGVRDLESVRLVRVKNTLRLDEIFISASLLSEAEQHPDISIFGEPFDWTFDAAGNCSTW
jgi:hypothetical protein